jgi:hypothetical protein
LGTAPNGEGRGCLLRSARVVVGVDIVAALLAVPQKLAALAPKCSLDEVGLRPTKELAL